MLSDLVSQSTELTEAQSRPKTTDKMSTHSNDYESDEYDSDEPARLELDLNKLRDIATKALHTTCTSATKLTRGGFHEIFTLEFEKAGGNPPESLVRSNFVCIARVARTSDCLAKEESEIATMRYVRKHTTLPVPEIYYHDLSPYNDVGAPFTLLEKLPGQHLYKTWDDLSLEHKKKALSEVASIVVQLSSLHFDKIGCLTEDGLGPVINQGLEPGQGPFHSTLGYLKAFVSADRTEDSELADALREVQKVLDVFMSENEIATLQPPFAMIHADLDAQNMLFMDAPDGSGPMLTGLIDWEWAHSGPKYFLYDYPIFIQDVDFSKHLYAENALLRPHFVSEIFKRLPTPEEKRDFIDCINAKNYILNRFNDCFIKMDCDQDFMVVNSYLEGIQDGSGTAYSGKSDYVDEYYSEQGLPITVEAFRELQKATAEPKTFMDWLLKRMSEVLSKLMSAR